MAEEKRGWTRLVRQLGQVSTRVTHQTTLVEERGWTYLRYRLGACRLDEEAGEGLRRSG
jgi:hypothetical protein